jgi:hypothetical protein
MRPLDLPGRARYAGCVLSTLLLLVIVWFATRSAVAKLPSGTQPPPAEWTATLRNVAVVIAITGLALRLVGYGGSLRLDEFGTLWAIEADLASLFERSNDFHGQSPLYYLVVRVFVGVLGESEISLRLPSMLATIGAAWLVYLTGRVLHGPRAGVYAAGAFCLSLWGVHASANARPYGLALLFCALAFYGFIRATIDGRASSRAWFVAGVVGLIASHYLLALTLLGLGSAYLITPSLREHYPAHRFSFDVALMALLSLPLLPQILKLWTRRGELSWIAEVRYQTVFLTIGPEIVLVTAGLAAGAFRIFRSKRRGTFAILGLSTIVPPLILVLLVQVGTNLLAPRYLLGSLVPICLLAGVALAITPAKPLYAGWFGWAILNCLYLFTIFSHTATFNGIGAQDWRHATAELGHRLEVDGGAPVLFRSGFVEDDQLPAGLSVATATFAPLRSPGQLMPTWSVVPLTSTWLANGREEYFERVVTPAIEDQDVFYYFSDISGTGYEDRVALWVRERFDGRFREEWFDVGHGLVGGRFSSSMSEAGPDERSRDTNGSSL